MNGKQIKAILYAPFMLLLLIVNLYSESIRVYADKKNVEFKDSISIIILAQGVGKYQKITFPENLKNDFKILSYKTKWETKIVDSKKVKIKTLKLKLKPLRKGEIVLQPFSFKVKNQIIKSNSVRFFVYEKLEGKLLSAFVTTNKTKAFEKEQIILRFNLISDIDIDSIEIQKPLSIENVYIEEFPSSGRVSGKEITIDGKKALRYEVKKIAIFPYSQSEITIPETILKIKTKTQETYYRKTEPITIKIIKLPVNESLKNKIAVGKFLIKSDIEKKELTVNELFNITVTIRGEGNIKNLPLPEIRGKKNFKILSYSSKTNISYEKDTISGEILLSYKMLPKKSGPQWLPVFCMWFFEPQLKILKNICTKSIKINVLKIKKTTPLKTTEIKIPQLEKDQKYLSKWSHPFYLTPQFLVALLLILILSPFTNALLQILKEKDQLTKKEYEKKKINKITIKKLKKAKKIKDKIKKYKNIKEAIKNYIEKRFSIPPFSEELIKKTLIKQGVKKEVADRFIEHIETVNKIIYHPEKSSPYELDFESLINTIVKIEKCIKK